MEAERLGLASRQVRFDLEHTPEERWGKELTKSGQAPPYSLSFIPRPTPDAWFAGSKPCVAVLREEGSNGDR